MPPFVIPEGFKETAFDLVFPVYGDVIPSDHAYHLYGAINRVLGDKLHSPKDLLWRMVGVSRINGEALAGERTLRITQNSCLTIRATPKTAHDLLALSGMPLDLDDGFVILLGRPKPYMLPNAPVLYSRMVTIKSHGEPDDFIKMANLQLGNLGIKAEAELVVNNDKAIRRFMEIKGGKVMGYAVRVPGLNHRDSVALQTFGIGGRRRFGCGLFIRNTGS